MAGGAGGSEEVWSSRVFHALRIEFECDKSYKDVSARCFINGRRIERSGAIKGIYVFLFNAICNTFDDVVHYALMIPIRFVVTESHHSPAFDLRIPVDLNDSVVQLFSTELHASANL